jgi:16S rRNA (adenine1518-N6/adenine1519-N6)-dimethyltransferase
MKYGQHFLTSKRVANQIVSYADITKNDIILEIGPGKGILTKILVEKAKKVYAVEIDKRLFFLLKTKFKDQKNLKLINKDILNIEFPREVNKIVSNLPFEISSPITEKVFDFLKGKKLAVLTYQKEFAKRLVAKPGTRDYSRITILAQNMSKVKLVKTINKKYFRPVPKVNSAVVRIFSKNRKKDKRLLFIAKILFQHKKQLVRKALVSSKRYFKQKYRKDIKRVIHDKIKMKKRVFQLKESDIERIKNRIGGLIDYRD